MNVVIPKVGLTVSECEIGTWLYQVGDRVEVGAVLLEVYADKVDLEIEAPTGGVLTEQRANVGDVVKVGETIAVIDSD